MMLDWSIALLAVVAGYLIGSIAFARVVGYFVLPDGPAATTAITWGEGQGFFAENVSATTVAQQRGSRFGCFIATLDILKATLPVLALRLLYPDQPYDALAAVAILVGHNFPIYYRFKGGRGTSVLLGSLLVLAPTSIPVTIFFGNLIGLFIVKDVLLAHHAGWILLLPLWFALTGQWDLVLYGLAVNVVRWSVSGPEIRAYLAYRRSGELKTRAFHEAIEKTHIGYLHRFFRTRGWIKYPYMNE